MKQKELITTRLKLKDVYPDIAGKIAEDLEVKSDDVEFIRKGITPANLEIKEGERAIISYITTGAKDRDGEIVLPQGAVLSEYRKNPVVLFGHDYSSLPIGKNMWIKSDEKGLIAKTQYAKHDEAEKVYQYRKDGFPLAESIGFIPLQAYSAKWTMDGPKWEEGTAKILKEEYGLSAKDLKGVYAVYTKWTMLEYSDVAVPANPEATQIAIGKGLIPKDYHGEDCDCGCNTKSEAVEKSVIPYKNLGLASEDTEWDGPKERRESDVDDLKLMCTWYDEENADTKAAYKLPHHRASDYRAVWRGVSAAMGALLGARGGVDIPEGDRQRVYNHLARHYRDFDKEPPEFKSLDEIMLEKNADIKSLIDTAVADAIEKQLKPFFDQLEEKTLNDDSNGEEETDDEFEFDFEEDNEIELDFEPDDIKSTIADAISDGMKANKDNMISSIKQLTEDEINRQKGRIISSEGSG